MCKCTHRLSGHELPRMPQLSFHICMGIPNLASISCGMLIRSKSLLHDQQYLASKRHCCKHEAFVTCLYILVPSLAFPAHLISRCRNGNGSWMLQSLRRRMRPGQRPPSRFQAEAAESLARPAPDLPQAADGVDSNLASLVTSWDPLELSSVMRQVGTDRPC